MFLEENWNNSSWVWDKQKFLGWTQYLWFLRKKLRNLVFSKLKLLYLKDTIKKVKRIYMDLFPEYINKPCKSIFRRIIIRKRVEEMMWTVYKRTYVNAHREQEKIFDIISYKVNTNYITNKIALHWLKFKSWTISRLQECETTRYLIHCLVDMQNHTTTL